ncbi:MAG TPA: tRNA threonylcarbamoyladenosine dehydratase [Firmicutes bacterium]|nr:tRNA threonylcarbamoyladenosine dehydratase [Bacillota bacterium]
MQEWLSREAMLLGREAVERLERASVAVFGLGGVGSYTAEALARAGVGRLVLVDGDAVADSNRNRQLGALVSTVGLPKAEVTAARVREINPACRVEPHVLFYLPGEEGTLLDGLDYAADAVDTVAAKLSLAVECRRRGIPLVSAMGCGNKLDPTRFRVADIYQTRVCPLCRVMRRELKARGVPSLRVVYSEEEPLAPLPGGEGPAAGRRALPGSVSFVPPVAGLILAGEIIRALAGPRPEQAPRP